MPKKVFSFTFEIEPPKPEVPPEIHPDTHPEVRPDQPPEIQTGEPGTEIFPEPSPHIEPPQPHPEIEPPKP